jgi:hypothetical protein
MQRPESGLQALARSLEIRQLLFGADSVEAAQSLLLIGSAHRCLGSLDHAERDLTTAVTLLEARAVTPADQELLVTARVALANVLKLQGKTARAEDLLEAVRQYDRESLPPCP